MCGRGGVGVNDTCVGGEGWGGSVIRLWEGRGGGDQ